MKRILKLAAGFILSVVILSLMVSSFACTGYYVGKDVSEDGTYLFGHTVDGFNDSQSIEVVVAHSEEPGRTYPTMGDVEVPLPDVTYQYTATPLLEGNLANAAANEMGVAMAGAVTTIMSDAALEMDPYTAYADGAVSEDWVCGYIAATCATALEAIETYGRLMENYGSAESNTFFIADQSGCWYLESYTGHQWVAIKCPDDAVAVFGNECMITSLTGYVEGETMYCSEGLFYAPEAAGLAVYNDDGSMNLFYTYCGEENLTDYSNLRTWFGHVLLAPSTAGEYDTLTSYDLFYAPDEIVYLDDIFELTRYRYEGTEWSPDETGRNDVRVIGIERQMSCSIVEIYPDLPAAMCAVTWATLANAEHSVYLPLSNLITDVAEMYDYVGESGYNLDLAHTNFKRLCALAEQDRVNYGAGVRAYWASVEASLIEEYPTVLAETAALYETDPEAAAEYITSYTIALQEQALAAADTMYDELTWYMILNTLTMGDEADPFTTSLMETGD